MKRKKHFEVRIAPGADPLKVAEYARTLYGVLSVSVIDADHLRIFYNPLKAEKYHLLYESNTNPKPEDVEGPALQDEA